MFKKLFGGGKDSEHAPKQVSATAAQRTINTIQQLSEHEESLEKRKTLLEKRIEQELEKARAFTKLQKKPQALMCLKKKKLLEQEVGNLDNMIMRVIEQRGMLESQRTTVEVVSTMHGAAKQAQDNLKAVNIEKLDKVLDEINEANDQMRQINETLGQPMGDVMDEDELLGELEELEATEMDKELLTPAPVPVGRVQPAQALPNAPAVKAKPQKTQEELELEQLQAEMAL